MKAKQASLIAKIIAAIIIIGALVARGFKIDISMDDAIKASAAVYLYFAPIDINIALDKIFPGKVV